MTKNQNTPSISIDWNCLALSIYIDFKNRSTIIRSINNIQQKLDAITNYLKANEDTFVFVKFYFNLLTIYFISNEKRREIINEYRIKRDAAKEYKQTYERCYQQIEVKQKK